MKQKKDLAPSWFGLIKKGENMSRRGTITSEEYKALRLAAGLTQEEARQLHGCQNVRTIKNWESGKSFVSQIAEDRILFINDYIAKTTAEAVDIFKDKKIFDIYLITYTPQDFILFRQDFVKRNLPQGIHLAMIARTYAALKALGAKVHIVLMNKASYFSFLGAQGLKDSEDSRAAWAASFLNEKTADNA